MIRPKINILADHLTQALDGDNGLAFWDKWLRVIHFIDKPPVQIGNVEVHIREASGLYYAARVKVLRKESLGRALKTLLLEGSFYNFKTYSLTLFLSRDEKDLLNRVVENSYSKYLDMLYIERQKGNDLVYDMVKV